jgi:hypothetical protein
MTAQTILPANSTTGGFEVSNSCRFDSASEQTLEKTQSAGNRNTATFSAWIKRTELSSNLAFFAIYGAQSDAGQIEIRFNGTGDGLQIGGYATVWEKTSASFKDISAWYHVVVAIDTTDSTANDRIKIYVNGVLQAAAATGDLAEDEDLPFGLNNADVVIGSRKMSGGLRDFFSGYMAEVVLIDGAALAPTSFGEFDSDSGIWRPIDVSGLTFGTNGFYLDFKVSANLGNDANGGTDLGETNIAAVDQSTDTCTNNFATLNPLFNSAALAQTPVLSEGNLNFAATSSGSHGASSVATLAPSSGKWYWETKQTATVANGFASGVRVLEGYNPTAADDSSFYGDNSTFGGFGYGYSYNAGHVLHNAQFGTTNRGNGVSPDDIVGHALDLDNGAFYFSINGTFQASGDPTSGASKTNAQHSFTVDGSYAPAVYGYSSAVFQMNFGSPMHSISSGNADANGHGNFEFAVPSGYFALNTKNLSEYG